MERSMLRVVLGRTALAVVAFGFARVVKSDYAKYGKLMRDIGFQPQ